ncbi:methylated-DNA--[protein]-cysteine S-methyltransferase [Salinifilum aidingensis]
MYWSTVDTPTGPFSAVVDSEGAVLASGWTAELDDLLPLISPALRAGTPRWTADLGAIGEAVRAYHDGDLAAVEDIAVRQRSGPYFQHAWEVLRSVPAGSPITYTRYADLTGRPRAARGAASACANNAAALFVPCHRVLRSDGSLGGFRWGLEVKRWLLEHERSAAGCGAEEDAETAAALP